MRSRVVVLALASSAACLFPDLSPLEGGDASADASSADADADAISNADATDAGALCDPSHPFSSVAAIAELDDGDEQFKPTLTPDELDIWYGLTKVTDAGQVTAIMHASRTSIGASFGTPTIEASIAPGDVDPAITDDALHLYYAKFGTVGNWDLFETSRPSRAQPFALGAQLPDVMESSLSDTAPFVAFDGSLYFLSQRSGANHVWRSASVDGGLDAPVIVPSLASSAAENGVVITHDGLWAYVSSSRTDIPGAGSYDTFITHRTSTTADFGPFADVTEINSAASDRPSWISWDNCRIYFESTRNGGQSDLFVATKLP